MLPLRNHIHVTPHSLLFLREGWIAKVRLLNGVIIYFQGEKSPLMAGRLSSKINCIPKYGIVREKKKNNTFDHLDSLENATKNGGKGREIMDFL